MTDGGVFHAHPTRNRTEMTRSPSLAYSAFSSIVAVGEDVFKLVYDPMERHVLFEYCAARYD